MPTTYSDGEQQLGDHHHGIRVFVKNEAGLLQVRMLNGQETNTIFLTPREAHELAAFIAKNVPEA